MTKSYTDKLIAELRECAKYHCSLAQMDSWRLMTRTANALREHADIVERISAYLKTARTESAHWPLQTAAQQAEASRPNSAPAPAK